MLDKLNKRFIERYSKQLETLNNNVFRAAKDDNGNYEVPLWAVGDGGSTVVEGAEAGSINLNPPARASVTNRKVKSKIIFYRVAIPMSEALIAADKPEYFDHMFDRILSQALINYEKLVGPATISRFGDCYMNPQRPGQALPLKEFNPGPGSGADDQIEFCLYGNFATEETV